MNLTIIGTVLLAALGGLIFLKLVATETELLERALQVRQKHWRRKLTREASENTDKEPLEARVYSKRGHRPAGRPTHPKVHNER
jgi:hypothetical protein